MGMVGRLQRDLGNTPSIPPTAVDPFELADDLRKRLDRSFSAPTTWGLILLYDLLILGPDWEVRVKGAGIDIFATRRPPRAFPERFERIIAARGLLLGDERYWRAQVLSHHLDLGWILPHLPEDPLATLPEPTAREALQGFLRNAYRDDPLRDEDDAQGLFESLLESPFRRGRG